MKNLQKIKSNQQSKYDEIIQYLSKDNGYWLKKDIWNINDKIFEDKNCDPNDKIHNRNINFNFIKKDILKNEIKYYLLYSLENKYSKLNSIFRRQQFAIKYLLEYIENYHPNINTIRNLCIDEHNWKVFLMNKGLSVVKTASTPYYTRYCFVSNTLINFINDFYDEREETEKDIWYLKNIKGVKIGATSSRRTHTINFSRIPIYYRAMVKRYFKTIITKKNWTTCYSYLGIIYYFFNYFYTYGYSDGFLENISRRDIEKYLFYVYNARKDYAKIETTKYVSWIKAFLEYTHMAKYEKAPKKFISYLIFRDDIPKREREIDIIRRAKFIPEPIIKQLDNNIMDLDRQKYIILYILLRETGWRGTDILNLRHNNCLEQIWNSKEQKYNYYLCGEITKTGISQLKIPIRDKVATLLQNTIEKAKELSTDENNPKKYLFNIYEGKLKGYPLSKYPFLESLKRLIKQKDIKNVDGELYHFKLHSLRHTRAKEYVEQGMSISIIQQILGHRSLQMTVHYATVTENTLYEKWKKTEDLNLFKVNTETNELEQIDLTSFDGKNLIRYEYVKRNLDAVRVPFGVCFNPSKINCKQQMNHCLNCASFCTTVENIPEYEEEICNVKNQIDISEKYGRELWAEKNKKYLYLLEITLQKIKEHKILHKNGASREDAVSG